MQAWDEGVDFRKLLDSDPEIAANVPASVLDEAFDLRRSLRHIDRIFDQLDAIAV